jgi:hypothetical protein
VRARTLAVLVCGAMVSLGAMWTVGVAGASTSRPTLGSRSYPPPGYGGRFPGFGTVAPRLVSANGDPNSVVSDVRWTSWGAKQAMGLGKSAEFAPRGGYLSGLFPVELVATDLGRCSAHGPIVYRRLRRRDKQGNGRWSAWSYWPDVQYPKPQTLC